MERARLLRDQPVRVDVGVMWLTGEEGDRRDGHCAWMTASDDPALRRECSEVIAALKIGLGASAAAE